MEVQSFLDYYRKVQERTRRVAACVPPEKLEWTYREGKFTLGDLIRHIASVNRYMFAEIARGGPSRYPGHGKELADGLDALLAFFERAQLETVEMISALTDEDLEKRCTTPSGASIRVWKWLRSMVEHEIHHRGQIYVYLAMLEVNTPPLYGLTSEQVRELSRRD